MEKATITWCLAVLLEIKILRTRIVYVIEATKDIIEIFHYGKKIEWHFLANKV